MKKLFTLFALIISLACSGQFKEDQLTYDLSDGDGDVTTTNFIRYSGLSFQIDATDLDSATATVQVQKSNNGTNFANISGAVITLPDTTSTNFIEVIGAKNEFYKLVFTVNTVTEGTLIIDITGSR